MQRAIETAHICPVRGRGKRRNGVRATSTEKNKMQTEQNHRPFGKPNGYGVKEKKQDVSLGSRHVASVCKRARCNSSVVMNLNPLSPARLLLPEPPSATTARSVYCPSAPRAFCVVVCVPSRSGPVVPAVALSLAVRRRSEGKCEGETFLKARFSRTYVPLTMKGLHHK